MIPCRRICNIYKISDEFSKNINIDSLLYRFSFIVSPVFLFITTFASGFLNIEINAGSLWNMVLHPKDWRSLLNASEPLSFASWYFLSLNSNQANICSAENLDFLCSHVHFSLDSDERSSRASHP